MVYVQGSAKSRVLGIVFVKGLENLSQRDVVSY